MELPRRQRSEQGAGPLARSVAWAVGRATIGEPALVFSELGRHRRLFRAWLPFAATLLFRTRLPRAEVEALILRTACNCSCAYEWAQHVPLARRAGLAAGEIAAIAATGEPHGHGALGGRRQLLLEAVDELHARDRVSPATWERLRGTFDERERLEICLLTGHYRMLAATLDSLGVAPEAGALARLQPDDRETALRLQAGGGTPVPDCGASPTGRGTGARRATTEP